MVVVLKARIEEIFVTQWGNSEYVSLIRLTVTPIFTPVSQNLFWDQKKEEIFSNFHFYFTSTTLLLCGFIFNLFIVKKKKKAFEVSKCGAFPREAAQQQYEWTG